MISAWLVASWECVSVAKGKKAYCQRQHKYNYVLCWYEQPEKDILSLLPFQISLIYLGIFPIVMFTSQHNKFQIFFFSLIPLKKLTGGSIKCFLLSLRKQCDDAKQNCGSCVCSLCPPCCVLLRPRRHAKHFPSRTGWHSWQKDLLLHVMKNIKEITQTALRTSSNSYSLFVWVSKVTQGQFSWFGQSCKLDGCLWLTSLWHYEQPGLILKTS